ncbi:MAG: hypothetical protein OHK0039_02050 [Bacteroidia bacterium]
MRIILLLHTLIQAALGSILLIAPQFLFPDIAAAGESMALTRSLAHGFALGMLGIAALSALGAARGGGSDLYAVIGGTLGLFHLGMGILQLLNVFEGRVAMPVVFIHLAMTLLFLGIWIWHMRR